MSGPRMGNLGPMNGSRRPNISRMNYHDSRPAPSYQDHRQSYHDHRQSSHDGRQHDNRQHDLRQHEHRPQDSRPYDPRPHDTRQYENRQSSSQQHSPPAVHTQHDELIKYIYESWSKVEMDKGSNNVMYYHEHENHHLKDFQPFDLEAYWGRRMHQTHHQQHPSS